MARFLLLITIAVTLLSCSDIFSTRDPEDPQGNADNYFSESVPELEANFKTALLGLDQYLYESLFLNSPDGDVSYKYISLASDVEQSIFYDWGIENEKIFINGLKETETILSEIDLETGPYDETADSLYLDIEYSMKISVLQDEFYVKGNFNFFIIKTDGLFWYIKTWTDISSQGNVSFSKLKEPYAY